MASITILSGNTNLWIARAIAEDNDGKVTEGGNGITVSAVKKLTLDRFAVEQAAGKQISDSAWKSFTLNKVGRVTRADNSEIVIED